MAVMAAAAAASIVAPTLIVVAPTLIVAVVPLIIGTLVVIALVVGGLVVGDLILLGPIVWRRILVTMSPVTILLTVPSLSLRDAGCAHEGEAGGGDDGKLSHRDLQYC